MEKRSDLIGSRQLDLKKSFNLSVRSLLTSCSKEEFTKAFSSFSRAEQESLHRLFIQIITSLNKIVEDKFETLCLETQGGTTLDFVEQLIEEQSLDPLYAEKSNLMDASHNLSLAKKNEINYLMGMLERAEEQNGSIRDRVELLKKGRQDSTGTNEAVEKWCRKFLRKRGKVTNITNFMAPGVEGCIARAKKSSMVTNFTANGQMRKDSSLPFIVHKYRKRRHKH